MFPVEEQVRLQPIDLHVEQLGDVDHHVESFTHVLLLRHPVFLRQPGSANAESVTGVDGLRAPAL